MTKTFNPRLLRGLLIISLLANVITAVYVIKKWRGKQVANAPYAPVKLPYYLGRDKLFEVLPKDSNAIVFLGNSLTQYYELAEFFHNIQIKNRGIHGDMLDKVLLRLHPIIAMQPKKIFIELGVNDTEQQVPKEILIQRYRLLLRIIKDSCVHTKIYMQSLLPVADTSLYLPASYCSPKMNKDILAVNESLKQLAAEEKITYINTYPQFVAGGQLNPLFSVDGVHLSGEGYALWTAILKPYVDEE